MNKKAINLVTEETIKDLRMQFLKEVVLNPTRRVCELLYEEEAEYAEVFIKPNLIFPLNTDDYFDSIRVYECRWILKHLLNDRNNCYSIYKLYENYEGDEKYYVLTQDEIPWSVHVKFDFPYCHCSLVHGKIRNTSCHRVRVNKVIFLADMIENLCL